MPKSIIREFDNSTTGTVLSTNFAVLVPGYIGNLETPELIDEAKKSGIYYEDSGIYRLNSVTQFDHFIGKFADIDREAKAPELTALNPVYPLTPDLSKYMDHISVEKFTSTTDAKFYLGVTVAPGEEGYGEDGYLLKTFYFDDGSDSSDDDDESTQLTYRFKVVTTNELWGDLPSSAHEAEQAGIGMNETIGRYFMIENGKEGNDAFEHSGHMGNQIARELIGLGYTVYFKKLDKSLDATVQLRVPEFWEPLKNKSTYRIRYLTTGGCYDEEVAARVAEVAEFNNQVTIEEADTFGNESGRGDVIALLDVNEDYSYIKDGVIIRPFETAKTRADILHAFGDAAGALPHSKYAAIFAPRVVYNMAADEVYGSDIKFPCSFHYLACAALAQQRYAEWYAVAGYTRGISSYSIAYTTKTFGDIDINTLAPRLKNDFTDVSINLILAERGNYYLWGNRTAYPLDSKGLIFSHFLNIRQLCCTIKQVLYDATRQYTFDPNSDLLWVNFVNVITPTLETMKADQGIEDYKISKVATDKKALLVAKIRIVPIEALEDFDISIYLEDSLSGITVSTEEQVVAE